MSSIARILVTNSSRINQKRIINKFGSYLLARNISSTQPQIEKTVQELTKENGNLIAELQQIKQDFEVYPLYIDIENCWVLHKLMNVEKKGTKQLNVSVHIFNFLQGRIAQLQKEKEEIRKEFGKKLTKKNKQIMLQLETYEIDKMKV
jgi:hypothetical protein